MIIVFCRKRILLLKKVYKRGRNDLIYTYLSLFEKLKRLPVGSSPAEWAFFICYKTKKMEVKLISKTIGVSEYENRSIDEIIVGQARVSSGRETENLFDEPEKLLRHCILNQHWSIFELANLGFSIKTSRAMGRELLRHCKHVGVTEFSQRYSDDITLEEIDIREQSKSNRQSSKNSIDPVINFDGQLGKSSDWIKGLTTETSLLYKHLIKNDVAKETARFILPECTQTHLYMNFRIRELITFLNARLHKTAQKEIRLIAEEIRDIFMKECPIISKALFNFDNAYNIHITERIVLEKYKVYDKI